MSTTIFHHTDYDPRREKKRKILVLSVVAALIVLAVLVYLYRYWPEERVVNKFFDALQQQNYEQAYAIWQHDPNWKQHPQKYPNYSFHDFYLDWGPGGKYGIVHSHEVDGAAKPPGSSHTGVIIAVTVNQRLEPECLWVEFKDKTMTYSPYQCSK
jgi:hypothetical protein